MLLILDREVEFYERDNYSGNAMFQLMIEFDPSYNTAENKYMWKMRLNFEDTTLISNFKCRVENCE
jgi:hypothetical protein